jgi:hypothetical protein
MRERGEVGSILEGAWCRTGEADLGNEVLWIRLLASYTITIPLNPKPSPLPLRMSLSSLRRESQ